MIKVVTKKPDGRTALMLGLSRHNLDKFIAAPLDTFIHIDGNEMGIDIDIMLFSGETEDDMVEFLQRNSGRVVVVSDNRRTN